MLSDGHPGSRAFGFGGVWSLATATLGRRYWRLVGAVALAILISAGASLVSVMLDLVILVASFFRVIFFDIPFTVGVSFVALRCVRNQQTASDELFVGFRRYWVVLGLGLVTALATFAATIPGVAVLIVAGISTGNGASTVVSIALFTLGGALTFAGAFFVWLRLGWATLIAVDPRSERPEFGACLETSWQVTRGRWLKLFGVTLGLALIALVSAALLVAPYFFLGLPLWVAGSASAYHLMTRDVFAPPSGACPMCGYDTRGIPSEVCPECGAALVAEPGPGRGRPADLPGF